MHKYIIMGPAGSGKGTQAKLLCQGYDLVHISVGDIFRWHIGHKTKIGSKVQRYLNQGRLVPDEMVADVVKDRLGMHDWRYGFVLDGFPRNAPQAEFFLENFDINAVIALELAGEGGDRADAEPPAVLGLRAGLQPDPAAPEGGRGLRQLRGPAPPAGRRHPRGHPQAPRRLPREDRAHPPRSSRRRS